MTFSAEMEYTRAYLAAEQAQFEDSLFVQFDTPHTMFRVLPLTLQPIVENAVRRHVDHHPARGRRQISEGDDTDSRSLRESKVLRSFFMGSFQKGTLP